MKKIFLCLYLLCSVVLSAQTLEHPTIWVKASERAAILDKIDKYFWAKSIVTQLQNNVDSKMATHQTNPSAVFAGLSDLAENDALSESAASAKNAEHSRMLQSASFSGMLYFITEDERYAQFTADILAHYFDELSIRTPQNTAIGGNYFYDPRSTYPHLAIAYDFVFDFLKKTGTKVYNRTTGTYVDYDHVKAQKAIKNIADNSLAEYNGSDNRIGKLRSNHPVLTAPGSLFSILMIDDDTDRERLFDLFWNTGTGRQNSFTKTILPLFGEQGIWPESLSYSFMPNISLILNVVDRIKPELNITVNNKNIFDGNFLFSNLRHPNRRFVRFGDSKRDNDATTTSFQYALDIATRRNLSELKQQTEIALNQNYKADGGHNPTLSNGPFDNYFGLELFWGHQIPIGVTDVIDYKPTVLVKHAGVALQRNYVEVNNNEYGLCGIIGGAHYVHSHATGISMELYGAGYVMAANGGMPRTVPERKLPEHTDYFRLYAGNNTVIVNGTSHGRQSGSWARNSYLWQNTAVNVAAEPSHLEDPISTKFSFATQFLNDDINNCDQQRTLSTIRTSPTTAYYFDMFRSKSNGDNNFHDYIYHNIGDATQLTKSNGDVIAVSATNKYDNDIGDPVKSPGWRLFENEKSSSPINEAVKVRFDVNEGNKYMHLLMPAGVDREYTKALAAPTREAKGGYINKKTQVLAIRQQGEAWEKPYVAIFEPSSKTDASVKSVENLMVGNKIVGAKVTSLVNGNIVTDYIISNENDYGVYNLVNPDISFTGRFAIVRTEIKGSTTDVSLYIGEGKQLIFNGEVLDADTDGKAYLEYTLDYVYDFSPNSFTIEAVGETCLDKKNGKVVITSAFGKNYMATINGNTYEFTKNTSIENLKPDTYDLCITIDGDSFEQCYQLVIEGGVTLSGKISVTKKSASVSVTSGTAPYTVFKNDSQLFETHQSNFSVDVNHGDKIEVKSNSSCQGAMYKTINLLEDIKAYPNPSKGVFEMYIPGNIKSIGLEVYNIHSQLIHSGIFGVNSGRVLLNIEDKPSGIYFVKINSKIPVFVKLIKK
jgi:hypothetical protein